MNEAPKKIWWCPSEMLASKHKDGNDEIPYIREDLVDELMKALEHAAGLIEALDGTVYMARDALKKLEESDGHR